MSIAASRAPDAERIVTPLEPFYDLVYVFAIGQLSRHLFQHVDARTGAQTAIMALAVVYAWYMTVGGPNWFRAYLNSDEAHLLPGDEREAEHRQGAVVLGLLGSADQQAAVAVDRCVDALHDPAAGAVPAVGAERFGVFARGCGCAA